MPGVVQAHSKLRADGEGAVVRNHAETLEGARDYQRSMKMLRAEVLDQLDKFQTFRDGDLVVRLHPDEAGVMRDQVVPLARLALDTLSMGMSADLEAAIAEGATLVRVGTAIFGGRG